MTPVYLALGSNLGDRAAALRAALAALLPAVRITGLSPVYETAPQYVTDQPAFLNMVAAGNTDLSAAGLLARLKAIEARVGRTPSVRYGPRLIDLDILSYGDTLIDTGDLQVPHPRLEERAFVLEPLAALAPDWSDPRDGRTARGLRDRLRRAGDADEIVKLDLILDNL